MSNDEIPTMGAEPSRPTPYKNALASFIAADTLFGCAEDIIVVATGWLIFSKTKSTFALGMIGMAGFLPLIAFSLLTGMATDRFDRRRVLALSGAGFSIGAFALCWAATLDAVWPIYLIVVFISSAKAFLGPVSKALLPNLVPQGGLTRGVALTNSFGGTARLLAERYPDGMPPDLVVRIVTAVGEALAADVSGVDAAEAGAAGGVAKQPVVPAAAEQLVRRYLAQLAERVDLLDGARRQPVTTHLLARETGLLEQQDVAVGESFRAGQRVGADNVTGELHVAAEFLTEAGGHRCQRELRIRFALGAAQVRGHDDLRAGVAERLQRRHRGDDAARIGDGVAIERDVQVGAHEHAPPRNSLCEQVFEGLDAHRVTATCRPGR